MGRILVPKLCEGCGKAFGARRDRIPKGHGRYCSRECFRKYFWPQGCKEPNCTKEHFAYGLCSRHYRKLPAVIERERVAQKQWANANREKVRAYGLAHYYRTKELALIHYSKGELKCCHCGLDDVRVLDLDHINNDGALHRRSHHANGANRSIRIYQRLKNEKYPPGFQVLCRNCNFIKYLEHRAAMRRAG